MMHFFDKLVISFIKLNSWVIKSLFPSSEKMFVKTVHQKSVELAVSIYSQEKTVVVHCRASDRKQKAIII